MSRILVTGGLGQVGSHVAELLLKRGDQVVVVDNLATGRLVHLAEQENLSIIIGDIAKPETLLHTSGGHFDAIVHTAASYADATDWEGDISTNVLGTANIAKLAVEHDARLIYFQTALCYGTKPSASPIPLDYPRQPAPISYAISKTAGEFYIEQSGADYVTFRLANVIGPRNLSGPLPIFYKRIHAGQRLMVADARRDFVDVRDLADLTVQAVDGTGFGAYHFSSGSDVTILELLETLAKSMGLKSLPEYEVPALTGNEAAAILLDPTKTWRDFGSRGMHPLSETVAAAVRYYELHGTAEERTHLRAR